MIGPDVKMGDVQHFISDVSGHIIFTNSDSEHFLKFTNCENHCLQEKWVEKHRKINKSKIIIGNDVWIGRGVTIMRGVKIGNGAVIGADAVVNKDVLPYSVVGGIPVRLLKFRFPLDIINELEKIEWWNFGPEIMNGIDICRPQNAIDQLIEKKLKMEMYKPQVIILNPKNNDIRVE